MRVCLITDVFPNPLAGYRVYPGELARRLVGGGHQVVLLARRFPGQAAREEGQGFPVSRVRFQSPMPLGLDTFPELWRFRRALRSELPGAEVIHGMPLYRAGMVACAIAGGCRVVIRDGSNLLHHAEVMRRWTSRMGVRWTLRRVDCLYVSHPALADLYRSLSGSPILLRTPVDCDRFRPMEVDRDGTFVLMNLGRYHPSKGLTHAVEAMPDILRSVPSAELRLFGEGDQRPRLEALAARLGVSHRVRISPPIPPDRVPEALNRADVFLQPSILPETPNTLLEAMACARPIVCTTVVGYPELLREGETCLKTLPGDSKALAERVVELHRDGDLRSALGRAAREAVKETLGWDRHLRDVLALYRGEPCAAFAA